MTLPITEEQRATLRDYAAGRVGTRGAIERLAMGDYADLVIAMAQNDFDMPKPADTPAHLAHAHAILQPLLRHGD